MSKHKIRDIEITFCYRANTKYMFSIWAVLSYVSMKKSFHEVSLKAQINLKTIYSSKKYQETRDKRQPRLKKRLFRRHLIDINYDIDNCWPWYMMLSDYYQFSIGIESFISIMLANSVFSLNIPEMDVTGNIIYWKLINITI